MKAVKWCLLKRTALRQLTLSATLDNGRLQLAPVTAPAGGGQFRLTTDALAVTVHLRIR